MDSEGVNQGYSEFTKAYQLPDFATLKPELDPKRENLIKKKGAKSWGCDNLRENGKSDDIPGGGLMYFEGAEHEATAQGLLLYDIHGNREVDAFTHEVWVVERDKYYALKFGRIIALAGDHYSTHDAEQPKPQRASICGFYYYKDLNDEACERRFRSAVESLAYDLDGYLPDVAKLMDTECVAWTNVADGKVTTDSGVMSAKQMYHKHECGIPTDAKWFKAEAAGAAGRLLSLYVWFAYVNFDHFGADAERAYAIGHATAIKVARQAAKAATDEQKSRGLNEAYLYEAFASHYLTDLFSSGHTRAPRRKFHTPNINMTALAGIKSQATGVFNGKEVPIWDYHCRYMHDDDSATGLLVRNEQGSQWIQYGDKQLLEPGNIVNRARVTQCLQASVDELWKLGFAYEGAVVDPLPKASEFAAMKLTPKPMLSYNDPSGGWTKAWGGYDQHNPAPLWRAESAKEPETDKWTFRKNLDDHSKFERQIGSPKGETKLLINVVATPESEKIRDAAFRQEGQFMESTIFPYLDTGGFLQVQELMVDGRVKRSLNIWGPADVKFRDNQNPCFTIRNRVIDFDTSTQSYDPKSLHWESWYDGKSTTMFHFHRSNDGKGDIVVAAYSVEDPAAQPASQCIDFKPEESWQFSVKSSGISESSLASGPFSGTRFMLGNLLQDNTPSSPGVATLLFNENGGAQVCYGAIRDGKYSEHHVFSDLNLKTDAIHFLKKLSWESNQQDTLVLASASSSVGKLNLNLRLFTNSPPQAPSSSSVQIPYDGSLEDVSVMVGSALGNKTSSIIAIATPATRSNTIGVIDPATSALTTHTCVTKSAKDIGAFVHHHLTAVLPTTAKAGVDIVTVSTYKKQNNYSLSFTSHLANPDSASLNKNPFTKCTTTDLPDPLAPYASSGAYFSIAWRRATTQDDSRCIMEIFSFFGVLGVRMFNTIDSEKGRSNPSKWTLAGMIPYMGQTSIGAGRGVHGDWGQGFMAWGCGKEKEFLDSNVTVDGRFGFRVQDAKREVVGGWNEGIRKKQPS